MNVTSAAPQSTFVTVLAWIALIFNGFGVVVALMQNVMVNFLMPTMMASAPNAQSAQFGLTIFRIVAFCLLILVIFMTCCAYALLKRHNWARVTFIVMCSLGIAWSAICILLFALGVGPGRLPAAGPQGAPPEMRAMFGAMMVMSSIIAVAMALLFGWIIKRLCSPQVRAEFGQVMVSPNQSLQGP